MRTDRYNIDIKDFGDKGVKEVVIACHGIFSNKDSSVIDAIGRELIKYNIGVVTFDFPAHGKSNAKDLDLRVENCIQDIVDVEKYVGEKYGDVKISIFATSYGAYITLLKIFRYKTKYNHIILRAPAIKMDEILRENIFKDEFIKFEKEGKLNFGFKRAIDVPYVFYEDLTKNKVLDLFNLDQKINIIQGNKDEIAPIKDTYEFKQKSNDLISIEEIEGANHRMKKSGHLEQVVDFVKRVML